MNKISFLVALLAMLQLAMGQRAAQAQQRLNDKRSVETAEQSTQEVAQEIEQLLQELGLDADKLGKTLERLAEENAQELENWSAKYAQQWEAWGDRFEQRLGQIAEDQEGVWRTWSSRYEKDLNRWAEKLESDELEPKQLGEFVEKNLDMLSKMPLGQMVDQVLEDGVGELKDAPWESLEELGALAQNSLNESMGEIQKTLDESKGPKSQRDRPAVRTSDPRIEALLKLRRRDDATAEQRTRIDQLIDAYRQDGRRATRPERDWADREVIDIPRDDAIRKKVQRERNRQRDALKQFNEDLRRSSEESRKSELKARAHESRKTKRVDGKNIDARSKGNQKTDQNPLRRATRDRAPGQSTGKSSSSRAKQTARSKKLDSELDGLREEIERLRLEVKRLKQESDK